MGTVPLGLAMLAVVAAGSRLVPPSAARTAAAGEPPRWDLPLRALIATSFVLAIGFAAPALGPYPSAIAASFPLFASVLGVFTERHAGHAAASEVMRGLIAGLAGFTAFFVVIALALEALGIAISYLLALAAVTLVQAITLRRLRRGPVPLAG